MNAPPSPSGTSMQNADIRFLGRILGDVIRDHGGELLFRRTEYIRATSVDRHRGLVADDAVDLGLDALSLDETLDFVRGFMLFTLLANLAEDRQGLNVEPGGSLVAALDQLAAAGVDRDQIKDMLDEAQ